MTRHQLKPQPTAQERIAAKRKLQETPRKDYYLAQKYAALSYDYGQIAEADRETVQRAALDIRARLKRTVEDMIEIGRQLNAVKEMLPHGQFTAWVEAEFDMNQRVAWRMMDVARVFGDDSKRTNLSVLSADAVYLLAAPSTPDTVRWEVFERMEMLDFRPTRAQVKAIIDAHMPPKPPRPKQLPGPVAEPEPVAEPDAIEAEYTVIQPPSGDTVTLRHELLLKMIDGAAHKVFMPFLTRDEHDELFIALARALKGDE